MRTVHAGLIGALVLSGAGLVAAQSLADVARAAAEKNREAAATTPAKVYTNKDLAKVPDAPPAAVASSPPSTPAAADEADPPAPLEGPEKTEAYWKARMQPLREQLDRDRQLLAASRARFAALSAEADRCFTIGVVCLAYTDSLIEQETSERLRGDVERDERAIRELENEARRAGVPPGWLRP